MKSWVIARLTFFEASRRMILWIALFMGVAFLVLYGLGLRQPLQQLGQGNSLRHTAQLRVLSSFMLMAGLYVVNFLTVIMSVLTSVDTIAGEIASGTIHTVLAKPLRRWEVVLGKWIGFSLMLALYVLLMAGGVVAVTYYFSGYTPPNLLPGIALMWLNGTLLLSVSLAGGAYLSTLANGVLVFGLYGIAFIGGWIEHIGSFIKNSTAINIGIVSSLLFPSESIWRRAAYEMQSPLIQSLGVSPFSASSVPSTLMVVYAVFYIMLALALAMFRFGRRDL